MKTTSSGRQGSRRRGRILAFQALYAWDTGGCDLPSLLQLSWVDDDPGEEAASFARLLIAGAVESMNPVDDAIRAQLEHWDFGRIAKVDLALLRLGVYSLLFRNEIPAKVTIDESVAIAKDFGSPDSYRFVNGILDGVRKRVLPP